MSNKINNINNQQINMDNNNKILQFWTALYNNIM